MRVLVVGAGATGGYYGAVCARGGAEVTIHLGVGLRQLPSRIGAAQDHLLDRFLNQVG